MVQGRAAYIVACGPRRKGAKPGSVSVCASPCRSAAVYSGLTVMPSGVTQFRAAGSPPGADLAAALVQRSRSAGRVGRGASLITSQSSQKPAPKTTAKLAGRPKSGLLICEACEDDQGLHGRA